MSRLDDEQYADSDAGRKPDVLGADEAIDEAIDEGEAARAWLAERKTLVGASETPALYGVHKFLSARALYHIKRGEVEAPEPHGDGALLGQEMEDAIARAYARKTRQVLRDPGRFAVLRHPEHRFIGATLDRLIEEPEGRRGMGNGVLEIKDPSDFARWEWAEAPPLRAQVQLQQQMLVAEVRWGVICALLPGPHLAFYEMERDDGFLDGLVEIVGGFWADVEAGTPPDVDGHSATTEALRRLHPRESEGKTVALAAKLVEAEQANVDAIAAGLGGDVDDQKIAEAAQLLARKLDEEFHLAREAKKAAEERFKAVQNRLLAAIGDAAVATLPDGGSYSLRTVAGGEVTYERRDSRRLIRRKK